MEFFGQLAMMGIGLGFQGAGFFESRSGANAYNAAQQRTFADEQAIEKQRRYIMEADARRRQLENLRNVQRGRSFALAAATNQGSAFGSVLPGSTAQIAAAGAFNAEGISQNLNASRQIFDINADISQQRMAMANAQSQMQFGAGLSSFGGSLMGASGSFGRLVSGAGNRSNPFAGGGGANNGLPYSAWA